MCDTTPAFCLIYFVFETWLSYIALAIHPGTYYVCTEGLPWIWGSSPALALQVLGLQMCSW